MAGRAHKRDDQAANLKLDGLGSPGSGSSSARPTSAVWIIACSKSGPSADATRSLPRCLRVSKLDQPRLLSQLLALGRRAARGGRDTIDHPPGAHDDVINAAAGALLAVAAVPPIAKGRAGTGTSLRDLLQQDRASLRW